MEVGRCSSKPSTTIACGLMVKVSILNLKTVEYILLCIFYAQHLFQEKEFSSDFNHCVGLPKQILKLMILISWFWL